MRVRARYFYSFGEGTEGGEGALVAGDAKAPFRTGRLPIFRNAARNRFLGGGLAANLRPLIHSPLNLQGGFGRLTLLRFRWFSSRRRGFGVGLSKRTWRQSISPKIPTLRFRAKVMLGFAVVLAISAASLGIAYLGFERISTGVTLYRDSVSQADLARNIDRELISYRALARYYVVTGKDDDANAALTAEASLKDAIDQSMRGTTNPESLDHLTRLAREFNIFTRIFADILKVKRDNAFITQNQLTRGGTMLRYKLDDLASIAAEAGLPAVELGAKQVMAQYLAVMALANTFVINSDQTVAASTLSRLTFVDNSLQAISSTDEKVVQALREISGLLEEYRQSFG